MTERKEKYSDALILFSIKEYEDVLERKRAKYGDNHASTAKICAKLGHLHLKLRNLEPAERYLTLVLAFQETLLPPSHPDLVSLKISVKRIQSMVHSDNSLCSSNSRDSADYERDLKVGRNVLDLLR